MKEDSTNPYAPPSVASPRPPVDTPSPKKRTIIGFSLVTLCMLAYSTFVWILLASTGKDRQAGMLFLLNIPVYLAWLILLIRGHRLAGVFGFSTVLMQVFISVTMLAVGIGSLEPILRIKGTIIAIQAAIAVLVFVLARSSKVNVS